MAAVSACGGGSDPPADLTSGGASPAPAPSPAPSPAPAPSGSSIASLAASLQPGTWAVLNTSGFGSGSILVPKTVGKSILQYANKAVWDPKARRFMFMGAPHYEPHRFVIFSEATNGWTTGPLANSCQSTDAGCVSHSYDHNTIDPATGDMYHRLVSTNQVYRLRSSATTWTKLPDIPMGVNPQCCGALEWFPDRNELVYFDGDWGVWAYSPASNAWRQIAHTNGGSGGGLPKLPMESYHNVGYYSPKDKAMLFGGGSNLYRYAADGSFTTLRTPPVPVAVTQTVIAPDPVSGKFLVFADGNRFYDYDLATDTWTQKNAASVPPIWLNGDVFDAVAAPVSTHGVVMLIRYDFDRSRIFLYKHR